MTNEQREAAGCINSQQYDNITSALVANKIASKQWRLWLKAVYNCDSAQDIKQEMVEGIMQTIQSAPDQIRLFGK